MWESHFEVQCLLERETLIGDQEFIRENTVYRAIDIVIYLVCISIKYDFYFSWRMAHMTEIFRIDVSTVTIKNNRYFFKVSITH